MIVSAGISTLPDNKLLGPNIKSIDASIFGNTLRVTLVTPTSLNGILQYYNETPHVPSMHMKGFSVESQALSPAHSIFKSTHLPFGHNNGCSFGHP